MPAPTSISELSQTANSNGPNGATEGPSVLDDYQRAHASFIALLRDGRGFASEATVASASTADIGGANSLYVQITGTTTITSFGTNYTGPRFVRFAGALTLTHHATSLILPGGADITTAAGDTCIVIGDRLHAVLCAAGYNLRWLLRAIARKIARGQLKAFLRALQTPGLRWLCHRIARAAVPSAVLRLVVA